MFYILYVYKWQCSFTFCHHYRIDSIMVILHCKIRISIFNSVYTSHCQASGNQFVETSAELLVLPSIHNWVDPGVNIEACYADVVDSH